MGERDPRDILGLPDGASEDDLKGAYRRLALRYHPDRNRGDETAAARFREVTEAYAALRRDRQCPGASREGMAVGASREFAFAADAAFEFAFPAEADAACCPSRQIQLPERGMAGVSPPPGSIHCGGGGRAVRRGADLSASLCLVLGGVLIGIALPKAALVLETRGSARTAPLASPAAALAPMADVADLAVANFAAASAPPERPAAVTAVEDAPSFRSVAPAEDAPAGAAVLPACGAPLARAEEPVADVSADDHAAAPLATNAAAQRTLARPGEPARGRAAARAEGGPAGGNATSIEDLSGDPVARTGPPPTLAGAVISTAGERALAPGATAKAAALFAVLMRYGERAMQLSDVVGARSQYERAAALDPTSSTAAIAAGETYDPHVLLLAGATHPWLADTAKAAAWYERARALGDPAAVGLLARLR